MAMLHSSNCFVALYLHVELFTHLLSGLSLNGLYTCTLQNGLCCDDLTASNVLFLAEDFMWVSTACVRMPQ